MRVDEIMTRDVVACRREDTLETAARLMWDNDCGCLPVLDDDRRVVGMITDRDACMAAYTQGRRMSAIRVDSAMSGAVHAATTRDRISTVEEMMRQHQVRRIPVTDAGGRLAGIVSLNDVARAHDARRLGGPSADEVAETLAAVCRPRIAAPVLAHAAAAAT